MADFTARERKIALLEFIIGKLNRNATWDTLPEIIASSKFSDDDYDSYIGYSREQLIAREDLLQRELTADKEIRAKEAGGGAPASPRCFESVFIVGSYEDSVFQPLATCFAITPRHLLTAQRFMIGNRKDGYAIARSLEKKDSKIVSPKGIASGDEGFFTVDVLRYNSAMDYAILELTSHMPNLLPIAISFDGVLPDIELKVFQCPVQIFNNSRTDVTGIYTTWVRSGPLTKHHISCVGGLFAGSSGAPFITREGKVVGFHVESVNESEEIDATTFTTLTHDEKFELISDTVNSNAGVHSSLCASLNISKCKKLREELYKIGIR